MSHPRRHDFDGALHHVNNRALGQRPLFEGTRDLRLFLSLVARAGHRGWCDLLAYALLTTHFHLLLRTRGRPLPQTMAWIEGLYARWFNLGRRRDGPLVRGRYYSRRVDHPQYLATVVPYIEHNPVSAGLVDRASDYEWCSAHARARRRRPLWLARDPEIEALAASGAIGADARWVFEQEIAAPRSRNDRSATRDLLDAAEPNVRRWLERRAALADGSRPDAALAAPAAIRRSLDAQPTLPWLDDRSITARLMARRDVLAFCLVEAGALTLDAVATHLELTRSTAQRAAARHRRRLAEDEHCRNWTAALVARAIRETFAPTR